MATYKPLQSVVLTSSTTSITFSNIDQNYTDLIFVSSFLKPTAGSPRFRFNSDSSALYSQIVVYGNGTSASSQRESGQTAYYLMDFFNPSTTNPNCAIIQLHNYSKTNTFKTILERSGAADIGTEASVGLYRSTNAITSITINADGGSGVFSAGTTFDLYGIKSGAPQALGGDVVTTDGNYWYHTFRSTQNFTPLRPLTVDYLVVAGGGGGGSSNSVGARGGGGGGAGGYRYLTSQSLSATAYTATVGSGGASNTQGSTSSFISTNTSGGGRGGISDVGGANSGGAGGSGGGAGEHPGTRIGGAGNAGGYSPVEGYAGTSVSGAGADQAPYGGATGGGSSGTMTYSAIPPTPTNGTSNSITGSAVTYAVGGKGGIGDAEGATATAGGANTGTGGQGGPGKGAPYQNSPGGAGGSGVVIVRYPV